MAIVIGLVAGLGEKGLTGTVVSAPATSSAPR